MTLPDLSVFATNVEAGSSGAFGGRDAGFAIKPEEEPEENMTVDGAVDVAATELASSSSIFGASVGALKVKASGVVGRDPGSRPTGEGGFGEAKLKLISGDSLLLPEVDAGAKSNLGKDVIFNTIWS